MPIAPANAASPCAPGRASLASFPSPSAVANERQHEAAAPPAHAFDMSAVVIGEMVGRGAFGEVYSATHLGMRVAVKQIMTHHVPSHMMQDIQCEFQKEVEVMQRLNHPNIVAYIGSSVLGVGAAGSLVPLPTFVSAVVSMVSTLLIDSSLTQTSACALSRNGWIKGHSGTSSTIQV